MKQHVLVKRLSVAVVLISVLGFLSVSLQAFVDPQSVMDMVQVKLQNTDAASSIRGVYGGVGLSICIALCYLLKYRLRIALGFLTLIWGLYAISRIITIFAEGSLGDFGRQWLGIESVLCIAAGVLFIFSKKAVMQHPAAATEIK